MLKSWKRRNIWTLYVPLFSCCLSVLLHFWTHLDVHSTRVPRLCHQEQSWTKLLVTVLNSLGHFLAPYSNIWWVRRLANNCLQLAATYRKSKLLKTWFDKLTDVLLNQIVFPGLRIDASSQLLHEHLPKLRIYYCYKTGVSNQRPTDQNLLARVFNPALLMNLENIKIH